MSDFQFLQNPVSGKWVILAPRRSKRTNVKTQVAICPFCPGKEKDEPEIYRIPEHTGDSNWKVRVIPNKFPFTEHHEVVIHSPDHHKNFDELPFEQVKLIFTTYRNRFNTHHKQGSVYIFHNSGHASGESLPHPHTQLTVVPENVRLEIPELDMGIYQSDGNQVQSAKFKVQSYNSKFKTLKQLLTFNFELLTRKRSNKPKELEILETDSFYVFCPKTSEWPDEVWVAPKQNGNFFGSISDHEVQDLAFTISRLIQIFDIRHGNEFPYNFYVSPRKNWYLRLIPRLRILGGFELGTGVSVNTQDPKETFEFIKEHFWKPDNEKIKSSHQAEYGKSV